MRLAAKFFDSLGLITPLIIPVCALFQQLCKEKHEWDAEVSTKDLLFMEKWIADLNVDIIVDRYYLRNMESEVISTSLHVFGDASAMAYCAVVYLCVETKDGIKVSLFTSKSRLAPLSDLSIPRLDLLAVLIAARFGIICGKGIISCY